MGNAKLQYHDIPFNLKEKVVPLSIQCSQVLMVECILHSLKKSMSSFLYFNVIHYLKTTQILFFHQRASMLV